MAGCGGLRRVCAAAAVLAALAAQSARAGENLIPNGDFARTTGGQPDTWATSGDPARVDQRLSVERFGGRTAAVLEFRALRAGGGAGHAMLAQKGVLRLTRGRVYAFTCEARAQGMAGRSATVAIVDTAGWRECGLHGSLSLGSAWRRYRFAFRASADVGPTCRLQIWFEEPGTLSLAGLRLEDVTGEQVHFADAVPPAVGRNLAPNGAFAAGLAGWGWYAYGTVLGDLAGPCGRVMRDRGRSPRTFVRIRTGGRWTPRLYSEYGDALVLPQTRVLAASRGWIPLEPGARYTLSCAMRASRARVRAAIGVVGADPLLSRYEIQKLHRQVAIGVRWARYTFTFRAPRPAAFITVGPDLETDAPAAVDVAEVQLERGERATAFAPRAPVEAGIEPDPSHGVFTWGDPVGVTFRAGNHGAHAVRIAIRWSAEDYFGVRRTLPPVTIAAPARGSAVRRLRMPAGWRGYYRVTGRWSGGGCSGPIDQRIAVVPKVVPGDTVFGVNHAFPDTSLLRLARRAGVGWARDWSVKWQDVEPAPGVRDWRCPDPQIRRTLAAGMRVLPLLPPLPSARWASEAPADMPTDGYQGERRRESWAPRDPAGLAAFVRDAVARYRGQVRVWEFLNEPLYTGYSLPARGVGPYPGPRYTAADYVALLRTAAGAMHAADPGCRVIGGAGSGPLHLTREMLDAGLLGAVDVMNLHIYPGARAPEAFAPEMDALLRSMDAHGGRKPIWVTEFSYFGIDDLPRRPFIPEPGDWSEERLLPDERACADYTSRFAAIMLARGAERFFLHSGITGSINAPVHECCLFAGSDGAPRRIFAALAVLADRLGGHPRFAGERVLAGGTRLAAFETGRQSVVLAWAPDGPGAALRVPRGARAEDAMGRPLGARVLRPVSSVSAVLAPPGRASAILRALEPVVSPRPLSANKETAP